MSTPESRASLVADVAASLGPGWHAEPHSYRFVLIGPEPDCRIDVHTSQHGRDRLAIDGALPPRAREVTSKHPTSITVAEARGAKAIAGEITRRLLPDYLALLAEVKAGLARLDEATRTVADLGQEIAALLPGASFKANGTQGRVYAYDAQRYGRLAIRVYRDGRSDLEASSVTPDTLRAVIAALSRGPAT